MIVKISNITRVRGSISNFDGHTFNVYEFNTEDKISDGHLAEIKEAIETILSKEDWSYYKKKVEIDSTPYQLCPKCLGNGLIPSSGTATTRQCDVCFGNKIITMYTPENKSYQQSK